MKSSDLCQVCATAQRKYACPTCSTPYCSVACFKAHKSECGSTALVDSSSKQNVEQKSNEEEETLQQPPRLRPLTSLRWPYVPEESAYPDPLTRDDPKPLSLHQYESIATSRKVRTVLTTPQHSKSLRSLLVSIDNLRGPDRDRILQLALGFDTSSSQQQRSDKDFHLKRILAEAGDEALGLFRQLAEAIEGEIDDDSRKRGLDWELAP